MFCCCRLLKYTYIKYKATNVHIPNVISNESKPIYSYPTSSVDFCFILLF